MTIGTAGLLFLGAISLARGIGSEFMPALNEGDLMFMPIADPSISLEENTRNAIKQNQILETFPEVAYAVGFNDISYFSRMFKRHFGVTPSASQDAVRGGRAAREAVIELPSKSVRPLPPLPGGGDRRPRRPRRAPAVPHRSE